MISEGLQISKPEIPDWEKIFMILNITSIEFLYLLRISYNPFNSILIAFDCKMVLII